VTSKRLEIIAEPGKTSFTTRRIVDAPRSLVFEAFTKCEHLERWMGPRNLTMVSCESDLRVGGRYRFVFRGPDGKDVGFSGEFREIVAPSRIVRTFVYEPIPRQRLRRDARARGARRADDDQDADAASDRGEPRRSRGERHGRRDGGRLREARGAARRVEHTLTGEVAP
jgi:uncharacterized protein YndB with AHSA1/START domain